MSRPAPIQEVLASQFTLVDGGFDPIHPGHIAYFEAATKFGLPVVCLVASDSYVLTKHKTLLEQSERCQVLSAIRYLDGVLPASNETWWHLEKLAPAIYFKGSDWTGRLPQKEIEVCGRLGIQVVYSETPLRSSSQILKRFLGD